MVLLATAEEEGCSGKLSDQYEVLLHCISHLESFMGTHIFAKTRLGKECSTKSRAKKRTFIYDYIAFYILIIIISKNLATACSSAWIQMLFFFLNNKAEVCHNRASKKIGRNECNHQYVYISRLAVYCKYGLQISSVHSGNMTTAFHLRSMLFMMQHSYFGISI